MSKDLDKITEVFPNAKENEMIVSLVDALEKAKNKEILAQSEAGIIVSKELWEKVTDILTTIRASYITAPESELRALCAAFDAQITLYEELRDARFITNQAQKDLDDALEELDDAG